MKPTLKNGFFASREHLEVFSTLPTADLDIIFLTAMLCRQSGKRQVQRCQIQQI